eukprot:284197-Pelagomonas_calceolata.AAC.1
MSTAHVLQPPGTESSPFAAAQGSSPSIRYKNFKFDLEESTANGEAEKQQELQGQRAGLDAEGRNMQRLQVKTVRRMAVRGLPIT